MDFPKNNEFIKLDNPRAWRTYIGGSRISQIHNQKKEINHFPEEWIMSLVEARNTGRENITEGLSHLVDYNNLSLKDLIKSNPSYYLGEKHFEKYQDKTGVLVKLIDSAERLTVQVHPNKQKAKELFNSNFGKTECWYILDDKIQDNIIPCLYLGFKKGITREKWKELFDKQDIQGMLDLMHKIPVKKGDTVLIKGGLPHAIGQNCFLIEIQEPTDYTIRIERTTPAGFKISDFMCHQGLGFDKMFDCFNYQGMNLDEIKKNYFIPSQVLFDDHHGNVLTNLIGYDSTNLFKLNRIDVKTKINIQNNNDKFSGLYVLNGNGLAKSQNSKIDLNKGEQIFIPAKVGNFEIQANSPLTIMQFFGPKD